MAAANYSDPRQNRLAEEGRRLRELSDNSDHVKVEPEELPGLAPERFKVTFLCKGIAGIDSRQDPIYANQHEVEITCHHGFPAEVPQLHWKSPIWHPNIQHDGAKSVCVNKIEWLGGMGLDDLCHQMFDMVQYRNYHALHTPPYPLDQLAAKWVLEVAEPRGIVDKNRHIYVDDQPFWKPAARITIRTQAAVRDASQGPRVKIKGFPAKPVPIDTPVLQAAGTLHCPNCGAQVLLDSKFCERCGNRVAPVRRVRFGS
jgi:ubiquitin-protein ligase